MSLSPQTSKLKLITLTSGRKEFPLVMVGEGLVGLGLGTEGLVNPPCLQDSDPNHPLPLVAALPPRPSGLLHNSS